MKQMGCDHLPPYYYCYYYYYYYYYYYCYYFYYCPHVPPARQLAHSQVPTSGYKKGIVIVTVVGYSRYMEFEIYMV